MDYQDIIPEGMGLCILGNGHPDGILPDLPYFCHMGVCIRPEMPERFVYNAADVNQVTFLVVFQGRILIIKFTALYKNVYFIRVRSKNQHGARKIFT